MQSVVAVICRCTVCSACLVAHWASAAVSRPQCLLRTLNQSINRGAVGRVSDLRLRGRGFESQLALEKVSHTSVPLSPSSKLLLTPNGCEGNCGPGGK